MRTVVLQSHRETHRPPWLDRCLQSVQAWAAARGHSYRFEGDAFFQRVPDWYRQKAAGRPMVIADLARLRWAQAVLAEGADRVIWLDADVLVFAPEQLTLITEDGYGLGREVWVQPDGARWKARAKIHNAVLVFEPGNPLLAFYAHACERLVARYVGTPPPHLVGPRLLGVLHNLIGGAVNDTVGTFGPPVLRDVLAGDGPALEACQRGSQGPVAAANLGASLVGAGYDGIALNDAQMGQAVERLLAHGAAWFAQPA
ncbi:MAG: hypothetical protein KC613_06280 [Myxococcales bacterium]|nr:hypothetical protein [Myxococcales bacterium]